MLGFDVSERTISRWMKRAPRDPESARRWLSFLRNHREAIAAMDFSTVPTVTFSLLYCFFIIDHDRRRILHSTLRVIPLAPGLPSNMAPTDGSTQRRCAEDGRGTGELGQPEIVGGEIENSTATGRWPTSLQRCETTL